MLRLVSCPGALTATLIVAAATGPCHGAAQSLPGQFTSLLARVALEKRDSVWSFIPPQGRPFFSIGVCVVTPGADRESFDPENPGYAAWQHYPDSAAWANATLRRLRAWRFTTIGAWSDHQTLRQSQEMSLWLTPVLHRLDGRRPVVGHVGPKDRPPHG